MRHLRKSSLRASGLIWFRMPPSRLEVASEATIKGRTTVGGICRRTPPTAPGRPFCSWPRDATSHSVWAVSITPWRAYKKHVGVGTRSVTGEELQGVFLKNTPLWRCRRPWPRPLWGQLAEQPCGAGWVGRDPLWWPDGSGAEWERGCHTPSLQWPTGHAIEEKKNNWWQQVFFFFLTSRMYSLKNRRWMNNTLSGDTWMACTSLLLSSRAADAVEVPKDAAPLWRPLIMRPSFLYCSMGSQKRSLTPWTEGKGVKWDENSKSSTVPIVWTAMCVVVTEVVTYTAGQQNAWGQHLPECLAADSS